MKKIYLMIMAIILSVSIQLNAQVNILLYKNGSVTYQEDIESVDSIKYQNDQTFIYRSSEISDFLNDDIDSIAFSTLQALDQIFIIYNQDEVTVINPFANEGISITSDRGHVEAVSTISMSYIRYNILGETGNGSFKLKSAEPVHLIMTNARITNPSGAAVAVEGQAETVLGLTALTTNSLSDGVQNGKNGTIVIENDLKVEGKGTLVVNSFKKHAFSVGNDMTIEEGTIGIERSASDGIHAENYYQNGGNVTIASTGGDGIDVGEQFQISEGNLSINTGSEDVKGIKATHVVINGGYIEVIVSGNQSKGIKTDEDVVVNAGHLTITASGSVVLEPLGSGFDPSYCSAVKTDRDIYINGGEVDIKLTSSNQGGKGLSADGSIILNGGIINVVSDAGGAVYTNEDGNIDSYSSTAIKADGDIYLNRGKITTLSNGAGGKGISADGVLTLGESGASDSLLFVIVTTTGNRFLESGSGNNADYTNPKAVKSEGNLFVYSGYITIRCTQNEDGGEGLESKSEMYINGGFIDINTYDDCINASEHIEISGGVCYLEARGNDAVDSNGTLTVSGGFIIANGARSPEGGFDCDNNTFKVLGGIMIGTGGNTSNPTASASTQNTLRLSVTPNIPICVKNSNDEVIIMYQLPPLTTGGGGPGGGNNRMTVLLSDPRLVNGNYTIQYGGTITGGTTEFGYNTGGTYSGGSSRDITINSRLTTISL